MIIGTFRSAEDGFIGHIITLSIGSVPVAIVPITKKGEYELLIVGKDEYMTAQIGSARKKTGEKGGYLEIELVCPALPTSIKARMELKPSREGLYKLHWYKKNK
jgi:uncharacterized protein (DUF736 family)